MMEFVFDLEANGLNPDKIHCAVIHTVGYEEHFAEITEKKYIKDSFNAFTSDDVLIGHNIIRYDVPVLEHILDIPVRAKLVDTLALSWYLFPHRNKHGLADWGEEFGIPKPKIDDWNNLTTEEYVHRCTEDVKINTKLWEVMKDKLEKLYGVDGYWDLIEYLTFKMTCARIQEENKWRLNVTKCKELLSLLEEKQDKAKQSLQSVMPRVPVYVVKKRPAKPYKKDRSFSATGLRWKQICEENGIEFDSKEEVKIINGYKEPNANSSNQVKEWLFSLGWQPDTYKFVQKSGEIERKIPQIKAGDDVCPSILRLDKPELDSLKELGILTHRIGILKGFLRDEVDGYVIAGVQGLTNTLRFKHKTCVNIPSSRAPYGEDIRSLLLAEEGRTLCGSDMCSLEDRTKQHYMWEHDPEYVKEMKIDDFDPHVDLAVLGGAMTEDQAKAYKREDFSRWDKSFLSKIRYNYKGANYGCTYGAFPKRLSKELGIPMKESKDLFDLYWERNWSIKKIAEDVKVKNVDGRMWLYNPVSKFWYYLKADKDRFSTLNQGTATFCFDMWVKEILKKPVKLIAQFHDEVVLDVPKGYNEGITKYLKGCVEEVNKSLNLNRDLECDVEFGLSYSEIH